MDRKYKNRKETTMKKPNKVFDINRLSKNTDGDNYDWPNARNPFELTRDTAFLKGEKDIFDLISR